MANFNPRIFYHAFQVLGDIVPKLGSQITTPLELCPACNDPVPLTDLRQDICGQGHRWSRCGLTLCLAADARCSSCLQCGATVNNALTISIEAGGCGLISVGVVLYIVGWLSSV